MLHIKKKKEKKITNVDSNVKKLGYLCTIGGNVNSAFSITVCFLLKNRKQRLWSSNSTSGYILKRTECWISKRYLYTCVHSSTIMHNSQKADITQIYTLMDKWINKMSHTHKMGQYAASKRTPWHTLQH